MGSIQVMIAGDAPRRALLRGLLERDPGIELAGAAPTLRDLPAAVARLRPRVLLLDVTRGRRAALLALSRLRRRSPSTRVILLAAGRPSDELLLKALERGARGCVAGRSIPRLLAKAVRAVDAGEAWLPRGMASQIRDRVVSLAAGAP